MSLLLRTIILVSSSAFISGCFLRLRSQGLFSSIFLNYVRGKYLLFISFKAWKNLVKLSRFTGFLWINSRILTRVFCCQLQNGLCSLIEWIIDRIFLWQFFGGLLLYDLLTNFRFDPPLEGNARKGRGWYNWPLLSPSVSSGQGVEPHKGVVQYRLNSYLVDTTLIIISTASSYLWPPKCIAYLFYIFTLQVVSWLDSWNLIYSENELYSGMGFAQSLLSWADLDVHSK